MYNSFEYPYHATESNLSDDPNLCYSLDPSRFGDTHGLYRHTQTMATEPTMGRWQEAQRTPQNLQFENGMKYSAQTGSNQERNSLSQNKISSKPAEEMTLGQLLLMKNKSEQIHERMDNIVESVRQISEQLSRINNLEERFYHLENIPGHMHSLEESVRVMEKQLNRNCEEVRRIDRVVGACEFIHKKFHGLLCRLSRQRSADDFYVMATPDEI